MSTHRSWFAGCLVLACASLLAACGSPPPRPGEAFDEIVGLTCDKVHECKGQYPGADDLFELEWGTTVEDCRATYGLAGVDGDEIEDRVDQGSIDYDSDAAEVCIDGFDRIPCARLWLPLGTVRQPSECAVVFTSPGSND